MALAFDLSAARGLCPAADAARVRAHLLACGFTVSPAELGFPAPVPALLHHMRQDKKMKAGTLPFILARGIGQAFVARDVPLGEVEAFLERLAAG